MNRRVSGLLAVVLAFISVPAKAGLDPNAPTWWEKFQVIQNGAPAVPGGATQSLTLGSNVDVSNECGPQSETYLTAVSRPSHSQLVISFYDTRNDTTGQRFGTDIYVARSSDGGASFAPDVRASTATSNEHDCNGVFPCTAINYGNQQGDYGGVASYGGIAHPFWVDSRRNQVSRAACTVGAMEEVFTAAVK